MYIGINSNLIRKVLTPAAKILIGSQVESIKNLEIQIRGHDRQILTGYIPEVAIEGERAIYRGLHLEKVSLRGENIRLNIGQVVRGKPLKILEPIALTGEGEITGNGLNSSSNSPVLADAFTDLIIFLLEHNGITGTREKLKMNPIDWRKAELKDGGFYLAGHFSDNTPVEILADLALPNPRTLIITPRSFRGLSEWSGTNLIPFEVDLGEDVTIEQFQLHSGGLAVRGSFLVRP